MYEVKYRTVKEAKPIECEEFQIPYQEVSHSEGKPVYVTKYRTVKVPKPIEYEEFQIPYQEMRMEVKEKFVSFLYTFFPLLIYYVCATIIAA